MYQVLIADDEEIIRRGIARFLQKDPEIEVVAQAEDGEIALELARQHLPDLLFVDINMPFLNGLEFIEKLQEVHPGAVIIVVTGYDDFTYAQKALRLGVFDYLLKPIMEQVFYASLGRAKEHLSQSRTQDRYLEWARLQVEKNRASLIAEFLENWMDGRLSAPEVDDRIGYLGLSLPEHFCITLVHLFNQRDTPDPAEAWNDDLLYYAAENIAREIFSPLEPVSTCKNSSGDLVLISSGESAAVVAELSRQAKMLLTAHLPVQVLVAQGMGEGYNTLPEVYDKVLGEAGDMEQCPPLIREAKLLIETHYRDITFSLQDVSGSLHISPQHLSRLFRRETGVTFMDYVTRARIRKALELLTQDDLKMYEIADRVGYSSQHYFSSAFKKVLGVSPIEYRKSTAIK